LLPLSCPSPCLLPPTPILSNTIVWDLSHIATSDTSAYIGTYTFTVDSLLTGDTFVYGAVAPDPKYPQYPYIYAADFTVPTNSKVSQIDISYFPDYTPYNSIGIKSLFGFDLYQTAGGSVVSTTLLQDPNDPNMFFADYGNGNFSSMQITEQSTSPVPEPSTITLFGFGTLALVAGIYRRIAHT
jgi:PEP-CTERM motif